jgi:acyl-CoA synthetase (NDP forming)
MEFDFQALDRIFHPRALAVVGVSNRLNNAGVMFAEANRVLGFAGPIYAINPSGGEQVKDFPTYRTVQEIPGPVDHVIISVPAKFLPGVISDCAEKGVRSAAIFTSGFSETGEDSGWELEEKIRKIARESSLRIIGPNCMGIYYPAQGLGFRSDLPQWEGQGNISFLSQSGGLAFSGIFLGQRCGLKFQKVVSYGNETDLSSHELIDYFAEDPATGIILVYIEGTRDGISLARALIRAGRKKPVIVLKGGLNEIGVRAAASHTGAMGGKRPTWEAVLKQAGALQAGGLEELIETAMTVNRLPAFTGRRMIMVCMSGGVSVNYTDRTADWGFEMPELSPETTKKLRAAFDAPGTSVKNPIDMASSYINFFIYPDIFRTLDEDQDCDIIMLVFTMEYYIYAERFAPGLVDTTVSAFIEALKAVRKPVVVVCPSVVEEEKRNQIQQTFLNAGFPSFLTIDRALKALSLTRQYHSKKGSPAGRDIRVA